MDTTQIQIRSGDIFLVMGHSWISRTIRRMERKKGEGRTYYNHVGVFSRPGKLVNTDGIEALFSGVKEHRIYDYYHGRKAGVTIYRPTTLTETQLSKVESKARSYVGRKYGKVKIFAHLLDSLFGGRFLFRRLCRMDKYPICSWVVGYAFDRVGVRFCDVPPNACQPDDIADEVGVHASMYELVLPIQRI